MKAVIAQAQEAQRRANALGRAGDHRAAVDAGLDAERLIRTVSSDGDTVGSLYLSSVLTDLSRHLSDHGDHERAVAKAAEAVEIRRRLFASDLEVGDPYLNSVNTLAIVLSAAGRPEDALATTLEGVTAARELLSLKVIDADSLASLLHTLSNRYATLRRHEEALAASLEALDLYREAAQRDPERHRSQLVKTLRNVSEDLWDTGDRDRALRLSIEAVELYRQLAAQSPGEYVQPLVVALRRTGGQLIALDREEEAMDFVRSAVALLESSDGPLTVNRVTNLGGALLDLGSLYLSRGMWAEARDACQRSADLLRALAERDRSHLPRLAGALGNLASAQYALDRPAEAVPSALEAWAIRRVVADVTHQPDAFYEVAWAAHGASLAMAAVGGLRDALAAADASISAFGLAGEPVPEHVQANRERVAERLRTH